MEKDHEFLKRELALAEEAAASREQVEKTNTELVHELQNREVRGQGIGRKKDRVLFFAPSMVLLCSPFSIPSII